MWNLLKSTFSWGWALTPTRNGSEGKSPVSNRNGVRVCNPTGAEVSREERKGTRKTILTRFQSYLRGKASDDKQVLEQGSFPNLEALHQFDCSFSGVWLRYGFPSFSLKKYYESIVKNAEEELGEGKLIGHTLSETGKTLVSPQFLGRKKVEALKKEALEKRQELKKKTLLDLEKNKALFDSNSVRNLNTYKCEINNQVEESKKTKTEILEILNSLETSGISIEKEKEELSKVNKLSDLKKFHERLLKFQADSKKIEALLEPPSFSSLSKRSSYQELKKITLDFQSQYSTKWSDRVTEDLVELLNGVKEEICSKGYKGRQQTENFYSELASLYKQAFSEVVNSSSQEISSEELKTAMKTKVNEVFERNGRSDSLLIVEFLKVEQTLEEFFLTSFRAAKDPKTQDKAPCPQDLEGGPPEQQVKNNCFITLLNAWNLKMYPTDNSSSNQTIPISPSSIDISYPSLYNHTGDCSMIAALHYIKKMATVLEKKNLPELEKYPHLSQFLTQDSHTPEFAAQLAYEMGTLLGEDALYNNLLNQKFTISKQYTPAYLAAYGLCGGHEDITAKVLAHKLGFPSLQYSTQTLEEGTITKSYQMVELEPKKSTSPPNVETSVPTLQDKVDEYISSQGVIVEPPALFTIQLRPNQRFLSSSDTTKIFDATPFCKGALDDVTLTDQNSKKYRYRPVYATIVIYGKNEAYGKNVGHAFGISREGGSWFEINNEYKWAIPADLEPALETYVAKHASTILLKRIDTTTIGGVAKKAQKLVALGLKKAVPKNLSTFGPQGDFKKWTFLHNKSLHPSFPKTPS